MGEKPENTVTFSGPGPSYLLYAVPTGNSEAVALLTNTTTHPPSTTEVDLPKNTFVEVGGGFGAATELTQINILSPPDELVIPLFPDRSLTVGPGAFAILLRLALEPDVYELSVYFEGKLQIVKFTNLVPGVKRFPPES
jgi:hypothetical protein